MVGGGVPVSGAGGRPGPGGWVSVHGPDTQGADGCVGTRAGRESVAVSGRDAWSSPKAYAGQADRWGVPVTGQVIDVEPDQRALDEGEFTVVVDPRGSLLQLVMHPVPGEGLGLAVAGRVVHRDYRGPGARRRAWPS